MIQTHSLKEQVAEKQRDQEIIERENGRKSALCKTASELQGVVAPRQSRILA